MNRNAKLAGGLVAVVIGMVGMSFAAVPLYDLFCRVTGYGGETNRASAGSLEVLEQTVTVRFDASKARGMDWEFEPPEEPVTLRIGETGLAFFEAYNPTDRAIAGQASYNVTPYSAGRYFSKIDCFCFTRQVLQPGERVDMPVTFFVDPGIVDDFEAKGAKTITLSYTFHPIEISEEELAATGQSGAEQQVN